MIHLAFIYLVSLRIVKYFCINLTFKLAYFWAVMPDCDALGEGDGREEASLALGLSQITDFCVNILQTFDSCISATNQKSVYLEWSKNRAWNNGQFKSQRNTTLVM